LRNFPCQGRIPFDFFTGFGKLIPL